jgi:hypothetical protein
MANELLLTVDAAHEAQVYPHTLQLPGRPQPCRRQFKMHGVYRLRQSAAESQVTGTKTVLFPLAA